MYEIFGAPSSRTRRVLWTAEECGADYTLTRVDLRKGEHLAPSYRAMNPNGRVPTLRHGDVVLFESAAICRYIAERHPAAALLPAAGSLDAARVDQWICWCITELEQALWSKGKHKFALPRAQRIEAMQATARWEFDRAARVLADAIDTRPFIVGETFTLSDVLLGHTLNWARGFQVPLGDDRLEAYLDRLLERPACQAALAYDP